MGARMLAVYGKGGMGKSFFTSNLSAKLALNGSKVMQLGCDPKHDSCNTLFSGIALPTVGETWSRFKEQGREDELKVEDVVFRQEIELRGKRQLILGAELGGPEAGRGCGGRGIQTGFDLLTKFGMARWNLDYVVMDFLGDVVCGGFATPLSRSLAEEVIVVCGNDRQSLYAANNICKAAGYFQSMGGRSRVLGAVINRDDGSGIADRWAAAVGLPVLLKIPYSSRARDLADSCHLALEDEGFDGLFDQLATAIHTRSAIPMEELTPLDYYPFLSVFGAVESDAQPVPVRQSDLFGGAGAAAAGPKRPIFKVLDQGGRDELRAIVPRLVKELGIKVTALDQDKDKGLVVTSDRGWKACFGNSDDMDTKLAILSALSHSDEAFTYVDLRETAAPAYW